MSEAETEHGALLFETLRMVDKGGTFLKACDSELRQAVQLTQERGGKAVLSIKLVVKLAQGKQMVVEPSVAATVPKPMTMAATSSTPSALTTASRTTMFRAVMSRVPKR